LNLFRILLRTIAADLRTRTREIRFAALPKYLDRPRLRRRFTASLRFRPKRSATSDRAPGTSHRSPVLCMGPFSKERANLEDETVPFMVRHLEERLFDQVG
jgi:hypothetical protein